MDIIKYKEVKATTWEYIPDADTLVEYLGRKDLIELSKCCKSFRNQLERRVLENLSLYTWESNNKDIYEELRIINEFFEDYDLEKALEFLKNDLGSKLIFVKKFVLSCKIWEVFTEILAKLLPNIKSISIEGCCHCMCGCCVSDCYMIERLGDIIQSLEGFEHLEDIYISNIYVESSSFDIGNQFFPKSVKSIKIGGMIPDTYKDNNLLIYDTIDTSYVNLHSLTILTNTMLQSLSSEMPNLKEVKIRSFFGIDESILIVFLKANPQISKLETIRIWYNEDLFKIVLSYLNLNYLGIDIGHWEGTEVSNLSPNYSIQFLHIDSSMLASLNLNLINACKNLKTLELQIDYDFKYLDWSKLKQRINKLKLIYAGHTISDIIKEIDASMPFDNILIELSSYTRGDISKIIDFKLNNYKLITSNSNSCILKLINKTD
jgi:hypothetical protein